MTVVIVPTAYVNKSGSVVLPVDLQITADPNYTGPASIHAGLAFAESIGGDVREARDRLRAALINSPGATWPNDQSITIGLASGRVPRWSPSFDLAAAVGILVAVGDLAVDPAHFDGDGTSVRRFRRAASAPAAGGLRLAGELGLGGALPKGNEFFGYLAGDGLGLLTSTHHAAAAAQCGGDDAYVYGFDHLSEVIDAVADAGHLPAPIEP